VYTHHPILGFQAWPVRRKTSGYLPSFGASLPLDWYQTILLVTEAGVREWQCKAS